MLSTGLFLLGQKKDCRAERTGPPAEAAWTLLHLLLNRSYPTACRKQALQYTATTDHGYRNLCAWSSDSIAMSANAIRFDRALCHGPTRWIVPDGLA
jgi:hypothetical protein